MKTTQFLGFALALAIVCAGSNICPEESIISGCTCRQNRMLGSLPELSCKEKDTNLANLIKRLNSQADGHILEFESLYLENGVKVELGAHFFGNVTFRQLLIGTPTQFSYVSRIDPKAFDGPISSQVEHFAIRSYELANDIDLYSAITVLKNLEYLAIEGRYLQKVPANAFTPIADCYSMDGCGLTKLKKINFTEGLFETFIHMTRIEQFAFANLPALEEINLSQQDVYYIGDYAFSSTVPTNNRLKIDLSLQWNRNLKPESFSQYSLSDINRPVELILYGDQFISYLPEEVFRPFLDAHPDNLIRLGMRMNCSCEMQWLWSEREKYEKHFPSWTYLDKVGYTKEHIFDCQDDLELWQLKEDNFVHCSPSEEKRVEESVKEEL